MQPTSKGRGDEAGLADEDAVDRVLAGDTAAFEDIVVRWQRPLLNLAFRFCRDRGLAEEMAQEAFLKVYRSLKRWRRDAAFSTWMFSVALNHYRTTLRRHVPPSVELTEMDAATLAGDLADEMDAAARDRLVRRAVSLLPPKYRDAIVVYYFQEQDVTESAAILGLKPGTLKARLHRGRKLLEKKLKAFGHPRAQRKESMA